MSMRKLNTAHYIVSGIVGAVLATIAILTYINDTPRIDAVGTYSEWNAPNTIDFNGFDSYTKIDILNIGDSAAKSVELHTPFNGIYIVNGSKETPKDFEKDIVLNDLNPSGSHVVEIWARNFIYKTDLDKTYVSHARGSANVDFGYKAYGKIGWIFKLLDTLWFLFVLIFLYGIYGLIIYITNLKSQLKKLKKEFD